MTNNLAVRKIASRVVLLNAMSISNASLVPTAVSVAQWFVTACSIYSLRSEFSSISFDLFCFSTSHSTASSLEITTGPLQ
jgi:hypothetical protein